MFDNFINALMLETLYRHWVNEVGAVRLAVAFPAMTQRQVFTQRLHRVVRERVR